jgi:hypothetical protein
VRVVAIGENGTGASPQPVQRADDAHQESLHAARECAAIVRFDEQVEVIRLDRIVDETKAEALASGGEDALECAPRRVSTQTRESVA